VRDAIKGFAPSSEGGRDGLKPQHLKDLALGPGGTLCEVLAGFVNLVISGGVPLEVRPHFFGATLLPFSKKEGGVRPIAVGLTLRRVVAKAAGAVASSVCTSILSPLQLGVGTKGGAEAMVHAARRFLESKPEDYALVKLDFTNAFNSIRRDSMLEAVAQRCPGLLPLALASYGSSSHLWLGDETLVSAEGVQQGDPLGPLLFSLTLHPILEGCKCSLVAGYLDDAVIGDSVPNLLENIRNLAVVAASVGLSLNHSKCEIVGLTTSNITLWQSSDLNFSITDKKDACLLGSPLCPEGVDPALSECLSQLRDIAPRLIRLPAHEAYHLLKVCFAMPRFQYLLRTAPIFEADMQAVVNDELKDILSTVLNISFTDDTWTQASLPIRWGGIGVRDISRLSPSAFLSSSHSTAPLVRAILPASSCDLPDPLVQAALSVWSQFGGASPPTGTDATRQRSWDDPICNATHEQLLLHADRVSRARLMAVVSVDAGAWLNALPVRNLGLTLSNRELRVAVGLRLGAPLVREHTCASCGVEVNSLGHHGLSCRKSAGRQRRHAQANDILVRAVRAAGALAELEPHLLLDNDGQRADGATLEPWSRGRYLIWDFTCPDTLAPSYLAQSATLTGAAASRAEANKRSKYSQLAQSQDIIFMPIAIETLGTWGPSAEELCKDIGSRLSVITGEPRSSQFLKQRLSLAVQRGNAAAVSGTAPSEDILADPVYSED